MNPARLQRKLDECGHLHLYLDSGQEFAVSKHDCRIADDHVIIDSKRGDWEFSPDKVEFVDVEPSGPHSHE